MKRQSVISWLTVFCGILLYLVTPFGGPHARAQNLAAARNSGTGTTQEPESAGERASGKKLGEEQFTSIQVLKGVPADQLIPAMQFITASLGVDCEYCHDHQ